MEARQLLPPLRPRGRLTSAKCFARGVGVLFLVLWCRCCSCWWVPHAAGFTCGVFDLALTPLSFPGDPFFPVFGKGGRLEQAHRNGVSINRIRSSLLPLALVVERRAERRKSRLAHGSGRSHRPLSCDRKIASITAMLRSASSTGTGTAPPSRIARENASPCTVY